MRVDSVPSRRWASRAHTKGDGLVVVQNENAYKKIVDEAGKARFLRRAFVDRTGRCAFTPAETMAAVQTRISRLDTGTWHNVKPSDVNSAAAVRGPGFNIFGTSQCIVPVPPAYIEFDPSPYLRPFDAFGVNSDSCVATDSCTLTCVDRRSDGFIDLAGNCE
jgi:hypothetical protein